MDEVPVVVDIECFRYRNSEWIIKEIAISGDFVDSISLRPPFDLNQLSSAVEKQFRWITVNLHHMPWNSGRHSYDRLKLFVESVKLRYPKSCFYTKGCQKREFLSKLFDKEFHNLEDLGCPKYEELEKTSGTYCTEYPLIHHDNIHCARKKAKAFGSWLKAYFNDNELFENEFVKRFDNIALCGE